MAVSALTLALFVHSVLFDVGATVVLNTGLDIHDTFTILIQISPEPGSCC